MVAHCRSLLSIMVEREGRRTELAVYMVNQALETIYKAAMQYGVARWWWGG